MSAGKLDDYYWQIYAFLAEHRDLLDETYPDHFEPDEFEITRQAHLAALLVFKDGSRLRVRADLDDRAGVREYRYAYVYQDAAGRRVFQYDDAPHHPEISSHPHHLHQGEKPRRGKERVWPLDIPRVDFVTVVSKAMKSISSPGRKNDD